MTTNPDFGSRDEHLNEILAAFLEAERTGQAPTLEKLVQTHPGFTQELQSFFVDRNKLPQRSANLSTTQNMNGAASHVGARVRYFGDYELLEEVARGGMGIVYRARQVSLNRVVALKMILAGQLASEEDLARFRHEAEAAANLDHPNIVPIYEVGEHEGQQYFSMKLIEGGHLEVPETAPGKAEQRQAAELLVKVARAIHHAHQRGLLHRDLKPRNILIDANGEPLVTDFGLAKKVESDAALTQSGAIVGTPGYMAPEQASARKDLTVAADVHSLGAILYALLTGNVPFHAESPLETILQVISRDPDPVRKLNPAVDRDLETICLKCLQKDPTSRYRSAEDLAADLGRWLKGEPIEARPVGQLERAWRWCRRNPGVAVASTVAVLALVLGLIFSTWFGWQASQTAADLAQTAEDLQHKKQALQTSFDHSEKIRGELEVTNQKRLQFTRLSTGLALEKGLQFGDQHDAAQGILWLARSLEMAEKQDTDLQTILRTNLAYAPQLVHPLQAILSHDKQVWDVAYSPDGKRVATASWDGTARLWDAATGKLIGVPMVHQGNVNQVKFSADGKRLATAAGKIAHVWDGLNTQPLGQPLEHRADVHSLALSPDGTRLATWCDNNTFSLWNLETGQALLANVDPSLKGYIRFKNHSLQGRNEVVFSPQGDKLAVWTFGEITFWNPVTGKLIESFAQLGYLSDFHFSPTWEYFAVKEQHGQNKIVVHILNQSQEPVGTDLVHETAIFSWAFSPDEKLLATGCRDGIVRLWEVKTGNLLHTITHRADVWGLNFSPDGKYLLTGSGDHTSRLWDVATGQQVGSPLHQGLAFQVAFNAQQTQMVTASLEGTIRLWSQAPVRLPGTQFPSDEPASPWSVQSSFHPDGDTVITPLSPKQQMLLVPLMAFNLNAQDPWEMHWLGCWNGKTRDLEKMLLLSDITLPRELHRDTFPLGRSRNFYSVPRHALSSDGTRILTGHTSKPNINGKPVPGSAWPHPAGYSEGYARLLDVQTGLPIGDRWVHDGELTRLAFAPDGKTAVTLSRTNNYEPLKNPEDPLVHAEPKDTKSLLTHWDVATGKVIGGPWEIAGVEDSEMTVTPDGQTVLVSRGDTFLRVHLSSGKVIGDPLPCQQRQNLWQFSPDGKLVAVNNWFEVHVYRLSDWKLLSSARTGGGILDFAFRPDGKQIALATMDHQCGFLDVASGRLLDRAITTDGYVTSLAWSPDGTKLVTFSSQRTVQLWDAATGFALSLVQKFSGTDIPGYVAFNATGTHYLVHNGSETRVYPVPQPVTGSVEQIVLWTQVLTGMELTAEGQPRPLSASEWQDRKQRLEQMGGAPVR